MTTSNPLEKMAGYHLRRATGAAMGHLCDAYSDLGLRLTEASTLVMIEANPGIKQSVIGRMLDIKSANMAPLIGVLDEKGYIKREQLDGRSQGLFLSEPGKDIVVKIRACIEANEKWLASRLKHGDLASLGTNLRGIWRSA